MSRTKRERRRLRELREATSVSPVKGKRIRSAELRALLRRFPKPGKISLAVNLACILLGNVYLMWLIWHGQLSLTGLVLLVLTEGVLLSILEVWQRSRVPAAHRMKYEFENITLPQALGSLIGFVVGVGGAYFMWIYLMHEVDVLVAFCTTLGAWRSSGLDLALGMTLLFAISGLFADQEHYRRSGPPLVSSVSLEAMSRRITFAYGAVVIAIPVFGLFALATWLIVKAVGKREGDHWNLVGGIAVIAAFFAIFAVVAPVASSGPHGWAGVYLLGKVIVESLFASLTLLGKHVAGTDTPAAETAQARA
ncbi:MAG: hypothetical protein IPO66_23285 [Rhodanobacteraceae bacterium]|nr:hypothetical protein [Rhodanobacteraceae bacterium]